MRHVELPRQELERQLARGLRRILEVQFPSRVLTQPLQKNRQVEHGELRWIDGQRVAMESNLHNVLFIPADGVLWVANADHNRPAAECPYVRLDLNGLLHDAALSAGNESTNANR